jgi:hypothetical protein
MLRRGTSVEKREEAFTLIVRSSEFGDFENTPNSEPRTPN